MIELNQKSLDGKCVFHCWKCALHCWKCALLEMRIALLEMRISLLEMRIALLEMRIALLEMRIALLVMRIALLEIISIHRDLFWSNDKTQILCYLSQFYTFIKDPSSFIKVYDTGVLFVVLYFPLVLIS